MEGIKLVRLKDISINCGEKLGKILTHDSKLKKALGILNSRIEGADFIIQNKIWEMKHRGEVFVISKGECPMGIISLSHEDCSNVGKVSYWIGSEHWGNGYTTEAFNEIIKYARYIGDSEISACIPEESIFSKRIWEKHNSAFIKNDNTYIAKIKL